MIKKLFLYFNTLKYLKLNQFIYRIYYRFVPISLLIPQEEGKAQLSTKSGRWTEPCKKKSKLKGTYIHVLGEKVRLPSGNWYDESISKLACYNINYFDFILDDQVDKELKLKLIHNWIENNNDFKGIQWDAYPVSLRIVNWIKLCIKEEIDDQVIRNSILRQAKWLSRNMEYQLLGNHLFTNTKALLFAGFYLTGKEGNNLKVKGLSVFLSELKEQLLKDGASFELSPMYHGIMLDDLLDIKNLLNCYSLSYKEKQLEKQIEDSIPKMFNWLYFMTMEDERYSHFNDSSNGVAPSIVELKDYSERVGVPILFPEVRSSCLFHKSGYASLIKGDAHLVADVGNVGPDYIPGHAHADTLSFELSINKKMIIVNSGTSEYGISKERIRQRGTSAHSTLMINNLNSSEVWGGFRVARRAKVSEVKFNVKDNSISAQHDGYKRLGLNVIHSRKWQLEGKSLLIKDTLLNTKNGLDIDTFFHLHPNISARVIGSSKVSLTEGESIVATLIYSDNVEVSIEDSTYHPSFGQIMKNKKLVFKNKCRNETEFSYMMEWN